MTSAMSVACLPLMNQARLPMMSPTTSSNELTGLDDYFMRIYPPSNDVAGLLSTYAFKERGIHSISVAYKICPTRHIPWVGIKISKRIINASVEL